MPLQCDSPKEGQASNPETLDKFARENNFCGWFYTSAKENINVEEAAKFLVGKVSDPKKSVAGKRHDIESINHSDPNLSLLQILQRQKHFIMEDTTANSDVINLDYSKHAQSSPAKKCSC